MIRFQPDTWRDALLRPIAMGAPDAGVYVEIMAPDIRFAVVVLLAALLALFAWRMKWKQSPLVVLFLFVVAMFCVWLLTSGNGRYFLPGLLVVGPLCLAMVHRLPFTRNLRLLVGIAIVALQAFVVHQNNPWHWWGLAPWGDEPFFEVELDEQARRQPATYVTATAISYSLIAPHFPPDSRWVNVSSQPHPDSPDGKRMQAVFAASQNLKLLIPTRPDYMTATGKPGPELTHVINDMLARQRLALENPEGCRVLRSRGLASQAFKDLAQVKSQTLAKMGFWVCPLRYPAVQSPPLKGEEVSAEISKALDNVEHACPRFFPPNQAVTGKTEGGFVRGYSSDMKLFVLGDRVFYRYWRALNPMLIGTVQQVMADGFSMNCNVIPGRSGLPWERQL